MTTETPEARLKRMKMRAWRRGMKEMDLILGPFADRHLAQLGEDDLLCFDQILNENDQDLYQWVSGQTAAPAPLQKLLERVARDAGTHG